MREENSEDDLVILHITDTHLYADRDSTLLGMNTLDSLQQVLEAAMQSMPGKPDLLLATGDLVHDASTAGYQLFAETVKVTGIPVYCLPGNHDHPDVMKTTLSPLGISVSESPQLGNWKILLMDSTVPGEEGGHLDEETLADLAESLSSDKKNTLICLHHQPLPVGSQWIDRIGTDNGEALFDLIRNEDHVKAILFGHVHQPVDRYENRVRVLATPSTCIQFEAGLEQFKVSDRPPAARILSLSASGDIHTELVELASIPAGAKMDAGGY